MPLTYTAGLVQGTNQINQVAMGADVPSPGSRGQNFINNGANVAPGAALNHANVLQLCEDFHDFLGGDGWTWLGSVPGNSRIAGARLLDGTTNDGECAAVAHAFDYLLAAPAPYGFGMTTGDGHSVNNHNVQSYTGANATGFISEHNNVFNLSPNLIVNGNNYRVWGNHKVVQLPGLVGHFYDPCYRVDYPALANMALAQITYDRHQARLRDLKSHDWSTLPFRGPSYGDGIARLVGLAVSDFFFRNTHAIDVFHTGNVAVAQAADLTGWFVEWSERWHSPLSEGNNNFIYGPFAATPLVR